MLTKTEAKACIARMAECTAELAKLQINPYIDCQYLLSLANPLAEDCAKLIAAANDRVYGEGV